MEYIIVFFNLLSKNFLICETLKKKFKTPLFKDDNIHMGVDS